MLASTIGVQAEVCGAEVYADFIYWKTFQDRSNCSCSGFSNDRWNPGFRIGADYDFLCYWNCEINWTHFQPDFKKNRRNSDQFHYDCVDLLIGYRFSPAECFSLKPSLGIRSAFIKEHFKIHTFNEQRCSLGNSFYATDIDQTDKFDGFGPRFGLQSSFACGYGFKIFCDLAVSALYGCYKTDSEHSEIFFDPEEICSCEEHCNRQVCIGAADAAIGIEWETCVCSKLLGLRLGWEHHRYFNFIRDNNGDLSFDGLFAGISFSF